MSNFFELIEKRESCRSYSDKGVEKEKLIKCIEAARLAPSACNSQPWSFIVVNGEKSKEVAKCTQKTGMNKFTDNCPAFIIVCEEKATLSAKIADLIESQSYAQIDIGLTTSHICYAATEQGLSTCILGWFDEGKLVDLLELSENTRVRLVIAVAYAQSNDLRVKKRKELDEIMTYVG